MGEGVRKTQPTGAQREAPNRETGQGSGDQAPTPPPLCLGSPVHVSRAWSQCSDLPVGGRFQKSPPNLDPAAQGQRGLYVGGPTVQAPGKQIQTRGGADAENKLGLAGGCDPASLRTGGKKTRSGPLWGGGGRARAYGRSRRIRRRVQACQGPGVGRASLEAGRIVMARGAAAGSLVLHLLLHFLQHLLHPP